MKCPKCGYIRQSRDHVFAPPTECPACGVIYSKYGIEGLLPAGSPQDTAANLKRPSPVHEDSLKQARERVERRLRKKLNPNEKDEFREQTLQRARRFVSEGIRRRREEKQRIESQEQLDHAESESDAVAEALETPEPDEIASPVKTDLNTEASDENLPITETDLGTEASDENLPIAETDLNTEASDENLPITETDLGTEASDLDNQSDDRNDIPPPTATDEDQPDAKEDVSEPLPETTMASQDATVPASDTAAIDEDETTELNMDNEEPDEQDTDYISLSDMVASDTEDSLTFPPEERETQTALDEQASNTLADTPIAPPSPGQPKPIQAGRYNLVRLLPAVAWMILVAGIVGAVLSWTTMSDVQAKAAGTIAAGNNSLPIALLLGFAYLATGVLGFAFFWVSSMINTQLKEIRRILMLQSPRE